MQFIQYTNDDTFRVISARQLRRAFPNVSFPSTFPLEVLDRFNVFEYNSDPEPEYDPETQRLVRGGFRAEAGPTITHEWIVEDIPPAEIETERDREAMSSVDQLAFKLIFIQENRLRALEGKGPITRGQFINFIRGLI